jgi:hypothetical protein
MASARLASWVDLGILGGRAEGGCDGRSQVQVSHGGDRRFPRALPAQPLQASILMSSRGPLDERATQLLGDGFGESRARVISHPGSVA